MDLGNKYCNYRNKEVPVFDRDGKKYGALVVLTFLTIVMVIVNI